MPFKEIFVVEDNEDIREIIEFILTNEQYRVKLFATANSFQSDLSSHLPDLIVLDIMLPDGNGIDICKGLKHDERTAHIPILLMSAHQNRKEVTKESRAEDFINKPFDIDFFKSKIEGYLLT